MRGCTAVRRSVRACSCLVAPLPCSPAMWSTPPTLVTSMNGSWRAASVLTSGIPPKRKVSATGRVHRVRAARAAASSLPLPQCCHTVCRVRVLTCSYTVLTRCAATCSEGGAKGTAEADITEPSRGKQQIANSLALLDHQKVRSTLRLVVLVVLVWSCARVWPSRDASVLPRVLRRPNATAQSACGASPSQHADHNCPPCAAPGQVNRACDVHPCRGGQLGE